MAITTVDKVKLTKYLKEHALEEISYTDMCDALAKRGKITNNEFLEYFTELAVNEFNKDIKISTKHLTKIILIIESFVQWIHNEKSEINTETLDKIRSFKNFYDEYLQRTNNEKDLEFYNDCIKRVQKTVNKLYPGPKKSESLTKYINQINELNDCVKKLQKELDLLNRQHANLQEESSQKKERIELLSKDLIAATRDVQSKEKELTRLQEEITGLNSKINELEIILKEAQQENSNLSTYKEQFEALTTEVKELKKVIDESVKEKQDQETKKANEAKIEALVYQKILLEPANIDSILKFVETQGVVTDKNEIVTLLKKIKTHINVESSSFSLTPTYKIAHPNLQRNSKFTIDIPTGCKKYDVMLVSDFHLEQFDHKVLSGFDMLNDYCAKNGINLILNLGDFFHGSSGKPLEYDNAKENYRIIEQAISLIPKTDGLYHAVLGGNHDRSIAKYGFDPLSILSQEREDFISLGYKHSTINLNNSNQILGCFDIHHPDHFEFPINLEDGAIYTNEINEYLSGIYKKQGRSREDSYIDMLGHTHKSQYNYAGSYCFIPPFFDGKNKRGACHLRLYFDEDTNLECMVLMPLSIGTKLIKNNEIIHQKVLKR